MKLRRILALADGADRTARLAAWFQELFSSDQKPVLVGGAAVELYTGGAYRTADLDFVGFVPDAVAETLEREGFRRVGRHWVHEQGRVFIELPGASLRPGERDALLRRGQVEVRIIGPEELVVDRLAAWQFWRSEQDAVNALLIWRSNVLDEKRLLRLAKAGEVSASLASLVAFRAELRGREPSAEQLERWARGRG